MHSPTRVMFFCLGNICRSPLAHGIFEDHIAQQQEEDRWHIESSGTSAYHVGEAPDPGSQRVATQHGIHIGAQRAQQLTTHHIETFDYLIAMSRSNLEAARKICPPEHEHKLLLVRDFEPTPHNADDVPDPWGHGDDAFEEVFSILSQCIPPLYQHMTNDK